MYTKLMLLLPPLLLQLMLVTVPATADQQLVGGRDKVLAGLQEGFIGLEESQTLPEPHTREQVELLRHLNFVPPSIDFGKWSVGQTVTQIVTLFNQHTNRTVHLNAVAGPNPVFYSSFFGSREVPPQGNTTFSVVFLPRQLGAISTALLIQTSFGRAEFAVRGEGDECPYRLKPLVGIKAPMNATLTPEIHMYNPHERPLQILEVYSSGGEFQLELPSGGSEGPQNLWKIPPHSLKPVIRISFHGRTAGNHSAYIRIKIAEQAPDDASPLEHLNENVLVIPVEFEILPRHGAYARNPLADFGRLATDQHADALHFKLDMQNQPVDAAQRQLIGNYLRDIPGLSYDAHNASIVLDPKLFDESGSINDLLVITTGNGSGNASDPEHELLQQQQQQQFTVLVRAEIFKGGLAYDRNVTLFITRSGIDPETPLETRRTLVVRNNFAFPLVLYNLSLTEPIDASLLELSSLEQELLLQPGESVDLLQLHLLDEQATFKSTLLIASNVTIFELPLIACSGRLHVSTQPFTLQLSRASDYGLELDLDTVPFAEMSRDGFIILRNDNPMPIKITNWYFKPPKGVFFHAMFTGCVPAAVAAAYNVPLDSAELHWENNPIFQFCGQLEAGDIAVFIVSIKTYVAEETSGTLKVWTPYELIRSTVRFKASVGQLDIEQDQLQFKSCFPGKICSAVLSVRSTFVHPVHVKSVSFTKPGLRFKDFNAKGTTIGAQTLTKVGRIYFEPAALCGTACYIRPTSDRQSIFPVQRSAAALAAGQANNNLLYDGVEVRQRTELYRQFKRQLHAMSLTLHTEELPPLELDFSIAIEWPKLVLYQPLPPTPAIEVGQLQRQWITINNPSTQPLLLDYYISDPAYARRTQLSLPHEVIDVSSSSCYLTDRNVFSLPDTLQGDPLLLPAGATINIPVQFSAQQPDKYCTLLHVRSNLTLYEAVWLTARAVQSQFRFGNRRPGSLSPLLFEFNAEQFERCADAAKDDAPVDPVSSHTVVATRTFMARNAGVLPIRIEGFLIGRRVCAGYGFTVHDCQSFELRENESRKVEISFSTDFTTSRVQRTLTLLTNLSYDISYTLYAHLPAESLERCAASLPRPSWEPTLRNAALIILLVSFCLVLLAAVFDARAIMALQQAYDAARYKGPVQPTFNLHNIVKMQMAEASASAAAAAAGAEAAAAAAAAASALKAEQQHKLRNGQIRDLRKRTTNAANVQGDKAGGSRKTKQSWTWTMDMGNSCDAKAATTVANSQPKPTSSPKPSKKSTPVLQATTATTTTTTSSSAAAAAPAAAVRAPKKPKQTPPAGATPKPKPEPAQEQRPSPNAKVNAVPQQENLSPRSVKAQPETPKERVLKEQNGSAKKLGKTPGRERRKEQKLATLNGSTGGGKKSAERKPRCKQLNFNGNALATGGVSPLVTPEADIMITSPWETSSGLSFRDTVQTPPSALDNGLNWNPTACDLASTQLGPIGSGKRMPAATTAPAVPLPMLYQPAPDASVANSPLMESIFDSSEPPALDLNVDLPGLNDFCSNLYKNSQEQAQLQSQQSTTQQQQQQQLQSQQQWKLNELLLMQQREKQLLMANMESNNWSMNQATAGATWTPLGHYDAWPNPSVAHNSPTHAIRPGVGVIRPPPGLEPNYNNSGSNGVAAGNMINSNNHMDGLNAQERAQQMPTQYDPFTSPSSIWSDNWRQRNNHMN